MLQYPNETEGNGERHHAERVCVLPHRVTGQKFPPRFQTAAHAESDAHARRLRRALHDRLRERISKRMVHEGKALKGWKATRWS